MLKNFKPVTPGLRGTVLVSKKHLSNEKPVKYLTKKKSFQLVEEIIKEELHLEEWAVV